MSTTDQIKERMPRWLRDAAIVAGRGIGLATSELRVVPDFLIIGSKRGGTTSLHNYLSMHPGVLGLYPRPRGQKSTDFFFRDDPRGVRWYRSNFHTSAFRSGLQRRLGYQPLSGESSPMYVWDPRVARLARRVNPLLKAVVLVRNPVERAFSHWQERVKMGVEPLAFSDGLAAEASRTSGESKRMRSDPAYYSSAFDWYSYRARGVYLPQLQNWSSVFPRDQLLVIRSEDMYADVRAVVSEVNAFLDLPAVKLPTTHVFNASLPSNIPEQVRAELAEFYRPLNADLENWLGKPLDWS